MTNGLDAVEPVSRFGAMTWREMVTAADQEVPYIVDGMISAGSTLLYGEAKAGKSFFVSALITALTTGQREFLGCAVDARQWRIGLCWTDDRGAAEYASRIGTVLPEGFEPDIISYQMPIMRHHADWQSLYDEMYSDGRNLLIVDNLSQALNGSYNNDDAVREFFAGVRLFTRAGVPALIVGHSSEKSGDYGKSQYPLGSSLISASVRQKLFYSSNAGRTKVTIKSVGADAEPHELRLAHGIGARYSVLETVDRQAAQAEQEQRSRVRDKATMDRNQEVAIWIVAQCQGKSQNATAAAVASRFGLSQATVRTHLSRHESFGHLVKVEPGNVWTLDGPLAA